MSTLAEAPVSKSGSFLTGIKDANWSVDINIGGSRYDDDSLMASFLRACNDLPFGCAPDLCIIQYSSKLASKISEISHVSNFEQILSKFPSIQRILSVAIDDPRDEDIFSITLGSQSNDKISAFHIESLPYYNRKMLVELLNTKMTFSPQNFIMFPHPSMQTDTVISLMNCLRSASSESSFIGSYLSGDNPTESPVAFVVERKSNGNQITRINNGLVGLAISTGVSTIEKKWPSWQQSFLSTLKWSVMAGH
jgi:hypothetical protein